MRRKIRVVGAMIEREGTYLITQRPPRASLPLLWEFPGGRVESGETDEEALARELRERWGSRSPWPSA
jgi:8-oxo-dGTP diphosphatase